jgi:hypothetical protein
MKYDKRDVKKSKENPPNLSLSLSKLKFDIF